MKTRISNNLGLRDSLTPIAYFLFSLKPVLTCSFLRATKSASLRSLRINGRGYSGGDWARDPWQLFEAIAGMCQLPTNIRRRHLPLGSSSYQQIRVNSYSVVASILERIRDEQLVAIHEITGIEIEPCRNALEYFLGPRQKIRTSVEQSFTKDSNPNEVDVDAILRIIDAIQMVSVYAHQFRIAVKATHSASKKTKPKIGLWQNLKQLPFDNEEQREHVESVFSRIDEILTIPSSQTAIANRHREIVDEIFEALVDHFFEGRYCGRDFPDSICRDITTFSQRLTLSNQVDNEILSKKWGTYFLYRKARTGLTSNDYDTDLIVRDMLWLSPHFEQEQSLSAKSSERNCIGFFFSAIDGLVFEIHTVTVDQTDLSILGTAYLDQNATKNLSINMPMLPITAQRAEAAMGTITGSLRDPLTLEQRQRRGAWGLLVLRPEGLEIQKWMNVYLGVARKRFSRAAAALSTTEYDDEIRDLYSVIDSWGMAGVVSSRAWVAQAENGELLDDDVAGIDQNELVKRQELFHNFFEREEVYQNNLHRLIQERFEKLKRGTDGWDEMLIMQNVCADLIARSAFGFSPPSAAKMALSLQNENGLDMFGDVNFKLISYQKYQRYFEKVEN